VLEPKLRDEAALKFADVEVAAAAALGVVPVPEPAGVMVFADDEGVAVTPKAEVVAGVALGVDDDLPVPELEDVDEDVEVLLDWGPMEKEPLVE